MDGSDTGVLMQSNDECSVFAHRMTLEKEEDNIQLQNV